MIKGTGGFVVHYAPTAKCHEGVELSLDGDNRAITLLCHCTVNQLYSKLKRMWMYNDHLIRHHEFPMALAAYEQGVMLFGWCVTNPHMLNLGRRGIFRNGEP